MHQPYLSWGWQADVGVPLVLEEFGIARDGAVGDVARYSPQATVRWRDTYFRDVLTQACLMAQDPASPLVGANVWAWGGLADECTTDAWTGNEEREEREMACGGGPWQPGGWWEPGVAFTGDPPHERQGWYSIYQGDLTTKQVLREFAKCMARPA